MRDRGRWERRMVALPMSKLRHSGINPAPRHPTSALRHVIIELSVILVFGKLRGLKEERVCVFAFACPCSEYCGYFWGLADPAACFPGEKLVPMQKNEEEEYW